MKTTIDKAGRMVIPAAVRDRAGLVPGSELDVRLEDGEIRIRRNVPGPAIAQQGKRRVVRPRAKPASTVDLARWIEEERDRLP